MVSKLIALNSPLPQSGKSTLAAALVTQKGFRRMPFAGPIKAVVACLLQQLGYEPARALNLVNHDKNHPIAALHEGYWGNLLAHDSGPQVPAHRMSI
jgi:hypothetical protein